MGAVLAAECERARRLASLRLDGELSEVGSARLSAHVGRCADCAEFARDLDALTTELRAVPPVRPRAHRMPARRRSSGMRALQVCAATFVVAIAATLGSTAGSLTSRPAVHKASASTTAAEALRFANAAADLERYRRFRPQ